MKKKSKNSYKRTQKVRNNNHNKKRICNKLTKAKCYLEYKCQYIKPNTKRNNKRKAYCRHRLTNKKHNKKAKGKSPTPQRITVTIPKMVCEDSHGGQDIAYVGQTDAHPNTKLGNCYPCNALYVSSPSVMNTRGLLSRRKQKYTNHLNVVQNISNADSNSQGVYIQNNKNTKKYVFRRCCMLSR